MNDCRKCANVIIEGDKPNLRCKVKLSNYEPAYINYPTNGDCDKFKPLLKEEMK